MLVVEIGQVRGPGDGSRDLPGCWRTVARGVAGEAVFVRGDADPVAVIPATPAERSRIVRAIVCEEGSAVRVPVAIAALIQAEDAGVR